MGKFINEEGEKKKTDFILEFSFSICSPSYASVRSLQFQFFIVLIFT